MNESFVFYRSFADAIRELPAEQYKEVMIALADYALDGIEPCAATMSPITNMVFTLVKPQIDANTKRRESGRKGGRPSKKPMVSEETKEKKPMVIENESDEKPNANANVNANVKKDTPNGVQKKAAPKHKHGRYGNVLLTDTEHLTLKTAYGEQQAEAAIEYLDEYIEMKGYKAKSHYLAIRKWVFNAMKEDEIRRNRNGPKQEESDDEFYARLEREYL